VDGFITDFTPLAGDRKFADDEAIVGGFGRFRGQSVCLLGQEKGSDTQSRIRHNFGMARPEESLLDHPLIRDTASVCGRTPAQVLLRWGVQRGTSVIPKTSRRERLQENLDLFGFTLTGDQMATISALDRGQRFNDPGVFCEAAFGTFCPIYE
jgi:hypothetical protein